MLIRYHLSFLNLVSRHYRFLNSASSRGLSRNRAFSYFICPFALYSTSKCMDLEPQPEGRRALVVVDTDPGTDDALALYMLLAAERRGLLTLLGVTCVSGNTTVDNASKNALKVLQSLDRLDVPVYRGAAEPLIVEPMPRDHKKAADEIPYHGLDGFGDVPYFMQPDLTLIEKEHAVWKLIQLAQEHRGKLSVVCLGPLTNIALAMKMDEQFCSNLKHIYVMGGNFTATGNITASAEFNFHCDAEAAHIVLANARCGITIVPWEATTNLGLPIEWRMEVLGKAGTPQSELLNKIEKNVLERMRWTLYYACDSLITAVLLKPSMIKTSKTCHLTVELHGHRTRGQVVLDHLQQCEDNVRLVQDADMQTFKQLLLMAVDHPDCTLTF